MGLGEADTRAELIVPYPTPNLQRELQKSSCKIRQYLKESACILSKLSWIEISMESSCSVS